MPPASALAGRVLAAAPGSQLAQETLTGYFARNGYLRAETVGQPGEFALRTSTVDVFPPAAQQPLHRAISSHEPDIPRRFAPLTPRGAALRALYLRCAPVPSFPENPICRSALLSDLGRTSTPDHFGASVLPPLFLTRRLPHQ